MRMPIRLRIARLCIALAVVLVGGIANPCPADAQTPNHSQRQPTAAGTYEAPDQSNNTLEIPPINPAQPLNNSAGTGVSPSQSGNQTASIPQPPHLGISVEARTERYHGHDYSGLEVISVDHGSPAERAGLRGRGEATTLGNSLETAGAILAPLGYAIDPVLAKTGQLGSPGDLIIAVGKRRIKLESDLEDALEASQPGEIVPFTVIRHTRDGSKERLKIPVKLASGVPTGGTGAPHKSGNGSNGKEASTR